MPGVYNHFEPPAPAPATASASGHVYGAAIFRPPLSPTGSNYNLAKSTGSLFSDVSMSSTPVANAKRKRGKTGGGNGGDLTPVEWDLNSMNANMDAGQNVRIMSDRVAPRMRYTLAGQIDTPGGGGGRGGGEGEAMQSVVTPNGGNGNGMMLEESVYSDVDYRRALGPTQPMMDDTEPASPHLSSLHLDSMDSGGPRPQPAMGWGVFALSTIGGVMGKVWEFCKAGAFRGFHAGGGKSYSFDGAPVQPSSGFSGSPGGRPWCNEHDVPTLQTEDWSPFNQAVPGEFPQSDYMPFLPDQLELSSRESTPQPAPKRRQIGENDELGRNWVMVDEQLPPSRGPARRASAGPRVSTHHQFSSRARHSGASSSRRISVPVSRLGGGGTPSSGRRGPSRLSHTGSPAPSAAREPASFTQPRSSAPFSSSISRIPVPSQLSRSHTGPFGSPALASSVSSRPASRQGRIPSPASSTREAKHSRSNSLVPTHSHHSHHSHRRNQSTTSNGASGLPLMRGSTGISSSLVLDANNIGASPRLDAEAKHLAQRKRAVERDTDARVDAFNARLREMIRQGKEALGTSFEVYDDAGDGEGADYGGGMGGGGGGGAGWESENEDL